MRQQILNQILENRARLLRQIANTVDPGQRRGVHPVGRGAGYTYREYTAAAVQKCIEVNDTVYTEPGGR